jgi:3-isopropylmalate dehydrogenase
VEDAIRVVLSRHVKSLAAGRMGYSTSEVGDLVAKYVKEPVVG